MNNYTVTIWDGIKQVTYEVYNKSSAEVARHEAIRVHLMVGGNTPLTTMVQRI